MLKGIAVNTVASKILKYQNELKSISEKTLGGFMFPGCGGYYPSYTELYYYSCVASDRGRQVEQINAQAVGFDPVKTHAPLVQKLKEKNKTVFVAVDIWGGAAKNTQWLYETMKCNVIYTDVDSFVDELPKKFAHLENIPLKSGIQFLYDDKSKEPHWILGIPAQQQDGGKIQSVMNVLYAAGMVPKKKADLVLADHIMHLYKTKKACKDFSSSVDEVLGLGGFVSVSGEKLNVPMNNAEKLTKLYMKDYDVLFVGEESRNGEIAGAEDIRVIIQKPSF